jgi:hypothetical protein
VDHKFDDLLRVFEARHPGTNPGQMDDLFSKSLLSGCILIELCRSWPRTFVRFLPLGIPLFLQARDIWFPCCLHLSVETHDFSYRPFEWEDSLTVRKCTKNAEYAVPSSQSLFVLIRSFAVHDDLPGVWLPNNNRAAFPL